MEIIEMEDNFETKEEEEIQNNDAEPEEVDEVEVDDDEEIKEEIPEPPTTTSRTLQHNRKGKSSFSTIRGTTPRDSTAPPTPYIQQQVNTQPQLTLTNKTPNKAVQPSPSIHKKSSTFKNYW